MSQASIIINVSDEPHSHSNGLSGNWTVPAKKPGAEFGILVVYPTPETQDLGDGRKTIHWLRSLPLSNDIVGLRSDATAHTQGAHGTKAKWGLLLCEAAPDLSKELLAAESAQIAFLNDNPPDIKTRRDKNSGFVCLYNIEADSIKAQKQELSDNIVRLREKFEEECRKLVQSKEITQARRALQTEDQRLVAEADTIWAGPEAGKVNVNDIHKRACRRLGQSRPWCYVPEQLTPCPGCGVQIKENILVCPSCAGRLFEGIPELAKMYPKKRAALMYPEMVEPEAAGVAGKVK